ncbi:MAG: ribonuclease [Acidimicrobiaceae bacterium]|nr:ribonuclease [Acidimicrobiaceae bacterium]
MERGEGDSLGHADRMTDHQAARPATGLTTVYTDGACRGNPGPGGWAWAIPAGRYQSGAEPYTTNQRMEIKAALEAVTTLAGPLEVVSDSTYVVNCFRDRWWQGWMARGWTNSAKKPVANRDLWEPLVEAYRSEPGRVSFRWVKGHGADPMNDLVDRLAVAAAAAQSGRSGTGAPPALGPADSVRRGSRPIPLSRPRPRPQLSGRPAPRGRDT